jgi:hypothetical protein
MINDELSSFVKGDDCGLCYGMDWDEAIYCPQCFGSGKIIKENNLPTSKTIANNMLELPMED